MNLHVFFDKLGIYSGYATDRIMRLNKDNNIVINVTPTVNKPHKDIHILSINKEDWHAYINNLPPIDKIIFHPYNNLGCVFLSYLLKLKSKPQVHWCCWSYEIYSQNNYYLDQLEPFSSKYSQPSIIKSIWRKIYKKYRTLTVFGIINEGRLRNSYKNIDYFHSLQKGDYAFLKELSPNAQHIEYEKFNYLSLEQVFENKNLKANGNDIMVGHSATVGANQYEIVEILEQQKVNNSIVLPLAYGDPNYRNALKQSISNKNLNLIIQEEQVSKEEYYANLTKIGYAIFNVKIQQGLGNLIALIWLGTKVFIREESSIYEDFKSRSLIIFSTNDLYNNSTIGDLLTQDEINHNRLCLQDYLSNEKVDGYWANLVD